MYGSLQGTTIWKGPTFSECNGRNEVTLLHLRFWENNSTIPTCNREASISTRVEGNKTSNDTLYTSSLTLVVQPEMTDIVIECLLDDINDVDEPTNISLISTSSSWCNTSRNVNDTTTSPGAESDHAVNLHIIIPGSIIALFTLVLLLVTSLLLYAIHKKIWSISK